MATLNSQQYINIQCTTYKQIQNTILYNKWNHVPPVLSSNDCLMKEPKDFTCLMLVGFFGPKIQIFISRTADAPRCDLYKYSLVSLLIDHFPQKPSPSYQARFQKH